ncbi:ribonuclease H-like domain-containing protein [Tanacetum coccineum]
MSEPMPTIPTQSPFTYPNPNPSASPSFTSDDTSESFIPEPHNLCPTFTQTTFSQPADFSKKTFQRGWQKIERNIIVHPPPCLLDSSSCTKENKCRNLVASALPKEHMPIFIIMMMPRNIRMAVKLEEEATQVYAQVSKDSSKLNQLQARPNNDEPNLKFQEHSTRGHKLPGIKNKSYGVKVLLLLHSFCIIGAALCPRLTYSDQHILFHQFLIHLDERYYNISTARFDKGRLMLQMSSIGTFARECNVKTVIIRQAYQNVVKTIESQKDWHKKKRKNGNLSWGDHAVPPSITGTYMPIPYKSDIEETQSFRSETYAHVIHPQTKTKDSHLAVDIKTLPESDVEDPNFTAGSPSFSCLENVKSPRILCNKSGMNNRNVCKNNSLRENRQHLLLLVDLILLLSRNRPAVNSAGRPNPTGRVGQAAHLAAAQSNPAGWSKRPAPISAGRPVSAGAYSSANTILQTIISVRPQQGEPITDNDIGIVDSGCSRSMTGNKEKLDDFVQIKRGVVKFGGGDGRISGKGTIRTLKLDFENVYYVEELQHFNLFSVSQICDKKNKVLFTDTHCLVRTEEFQLPDESQVVLRIPRERDLYTFSISDLQPEQNVTCLVAKVSLDESTRWQKCNRDKMDFEEQEGCQRNSLARIEAIRLFLAFASYMGFLVYQMDVKSAFLYGEIEEEVQDRYVKDMLTKFDMESVRTATTPYEAAKTKLKDETDPPVNVHLYRSMIGSLMYLTASRPDIMFAVSACSRHQVTPLTSHLNAVKKIFKYLKGQPKLGLWYPKDSPFQLEAYSDSDYAGSHGDRKSTTGGCQFLGRRYSGSEPRTKHIEIRHHFIRDANEKNLIQVLKIHTDDNVADLLTKAFDGPRFEYLERVTIPLTTPLLAIAAAGDDADGGDDAANEDNAAANEASWDPTPEPVSPPTPPAQTFIFEEPLVFGPEPRPAGTVDNIISMEDDTTHGGFHVESPVRPDDAPTPTADAAGRAEDPALLTGLSAKLDRCMGRIDSLETELGKSKKIMGVCIYALFSRVKKLGKRLKPYGETRLVVDASAGEGDVDIQDDIDLDGLSRMASTALGHDQPHSLRLVEEREEEEVPLRRKRSAYRRARTEFSTLALEQFQANLSAGVLPHTAVPEPAGLSVAADKGKVPMPDLDIPAEFLAEDAQARKCFEEEQASERLVQRLRAEDLSQEDLPNVFEERAKELDNLMMRMTETDWLNLMMQVGSNPALASELLEADVNEENFIERMNAVKEKKKRALVDLRYRALKGKPMKKSELVEEYEYICRRLEKDRLLSAQYNLFRPKPDITEPPSKRQRVERASSQPASVPAATTHTADDPDSAGGGSSNPAGSAFGAPVTDPTVSTSAAMDSAGSHREIGVSPFADSAASSSPSNVSTDHIPIDVLFASTSGGIHDFFLESDEEEQIGLSRVAADPDSDDEVLAEIIFRGKSISGDGVVLVDRLPDDEIVDPRVKVEIVSDYASSPPRNRRKHLGVRSDDCLWDKPVEDFFSSESESDDDMENYIPPLPYGEFKDWEMVSCPPGNSYIHVYYQQNRRRKYFTYLKQLLPHVYREDILLLRRRMNRYFRLNPDVNIGLDLWRDVNLLCQSLHSDDVDDFWRTQDEWVVSSWKLYPKSSVHVLDLTNGKTVYMFVDKVYPIRATMLERMLRHRLTVSPSYCRDVVVAGNVIQTVQAGLRESYECLESAPIIVLYNFGVCACTARQMVLSSPWLIAKKESGSPLQTALVCNSNPLMVARLPKPGRVDMVINPPWNLPFLGAKGLTSPEQTATGKGISNPLMAARVFVITKVSTSPRVSSYLVKAYQIYLCCCKDWKLLFFDVAASFDSAIHRLHAVSFDAAVASTVYAACIIVASYIVSAGICDAAGSSVLAVFINICCILCFCCYSILLLREDLSRNLELTESKPSLGEDCWELLKMTKCRFCC